jgi:hydrogenase/urease accessory protein HupE
MYIRAGLLFWSIAGAAPMCNFAPMFIPNGETAMRTGLTLALAFTLLPTAALAHPGHGEALGLLHGLAHPPGSLEHTMAMVMVGTLTFMLAAAGFYAARLIARTRATWKAARAAPSSI